MYDDFAMQSQTATTGDTVMSVYGIFIALAFYVYVALMVYRIAHKTGNADTAWWAFIPIANTILLLGMAEKPMWWLLLMLIPVVNLFVFFKLWMDVARNAGHSAVWGFLVMIPLIQVVALLVLAYGSQPYTYPEEPSLPEQPKQPVG